MWKVQMAWRNDKTGHHKHCQRPMQPNSCCSVFDCSCSKSSADGCNIGDNSPGVCSIVSIYIYICQTRFRKKTQPTGTCDANQLTDFECLQKKYIWLNKKRQTHKFLIICKTRNICAYILWFTCLIAESFGLIYFIHNTRMSRADLKRTLFSYYWFR